MKNTFIPYGKQTITNEDINSIIEVLKSDFLTQGPAVEKFESDLCNYLQSKYVSVVSNGTAALHLASLALGLQPGDAVIIPAISFVATSNAVLYCGATPVFTDIDPNSGNICFESAEKAIILAKSNGLNPKAIFPVHFSGLPCEPFPLLQFAKKHNLKIVEDACHAIGAQYRNNINEKFKMVGSYADMVVWSFHPVKHITTGEGGAISTNNTEFATKLKMLRTHGITKSSDQFQNKEMSFDEVTRTNNIWYYEMQELGYNYRLPDILCALGSAQLQRVEEFIQKRKDIANFYRENLEGLMHLKIFHPESNNIQSSYHLFPLNIDFSLLKKSRNQVMLELKKRGIGTQVHYIPIPLQPYYQNNKNKFLSTQIINANKFYQNELSIPMYYSLTYEDCNKVIIELKDVLYNL